MIIYRDDNWIVVNKPSGISTHTPRPGELGAVEWLKLHLDLTTHIVSRLDRDTSGVLILALSAEASARAQQFHEQGFALKTYDFFSTIDSCEIGLGTTWQRDDELDGKAASTLFSQVGESVSLAPPGEKKPVKIFHYQAKISRGRRHQIRRHASAAGVPLLGDTRYGGTPWGRLCLHCSELCWPEIEGGVSADLPPSFRAILEQRSTDLDFAFCQDRRGTWLQAVTNTFRAVHRDEIAGLPVAVDIYGQWFNAMWFDEDVESSQIKNRLKPLLDLVMANYGCKGGLVRVHRRNPHLRTLITEMLPVAELVPELFTVNEHKLLYQISLTETQHTGLFLDQRDTRRQIAQLAGQKRLANLFSYTCSFSQVAVAAGAEIAFSIDVARPCLNTGKANFELNGLTESRRGKFVQEDVRKWLRRQLRKKSERPAEFVPLDLIICDPPVFASSKEGGRFSVEQEWEFLAGAAATLLSAGGVAIFANNHRSGDETFYLQKLRTCFGEVIPLRPPLDFPVLEGRPQTVRIYYCSKPTSRMLTNGA